MANATRYAVSVQRRMDELSVPATEREALERDDVTLLRQVRRCAHAFAIAAGSRRRASHSSCISGTATVGRRLVMWAIALSPCAAQDSRAAPPPLSPQVWRRQHGTPAPPSDRRELDRLLTAAAEHNAALVTKVLLVDPLGKEVARWQRLHIWNAVQAHNAVRAGRMLVEHGIGPLDSVQIAFWAASQGRPVPERCQTRLGLQKVHPSFLTYMGIAPNYVPLWESFPFWRVMEDVEGGAWSRELSPELRAALRTEAQAVARGQHACFSPTHVHVGLVFDPLDL